MKEIYNKEISIIISSRTFLLTLLLLKSIKIKYVVLEVFFRKVYNFAKKSR